MVDVLGLLEFRIFSTISQSIFVDSQGYSCAHWAAKRGDIAVLQILANFGADFGIKTTSDSGMMPIHWAASDGKILAIKLLLEHRQDINGQDNTGCTPLIIASQHNQISTVIYLMKNGADLTLRDNCQDSALHWAAYKGYTELVPLLANFMPMTMDQCDIYGQVTIVYDFILSYFSLFTCSYCL